MNITAKLPRLKKEATIEYHFGDDLADASDIFGEAIVFNKFKSASVVDLQAAMRRAMENNKDPAELTENWKPGMKLPSAKKDPVAVAANLVSGMTPEQKAALIAQLKA